MTKRIYRINEHTFKTVNGAQAAQKAFERKVGRKLDKNKDTFIYVGRDK